jgi:hypothetical protein
MIRNILLVVLSVALLVTSVGYLKWLHKPAVLNPASASDTFEEGFARWPMRFINGLGLGKTPPYHGGDIRIENSEMRLEISPDPNFDNEATKPTGSQLAAERYNNAFAIGFPGYTPNRDEKVVADFRMKVDEGYQGTTGFWLEAQNTFNQDGLMVPGGFPGAFGVSYTSSDSWAPIAGLKFEYAKGFAPLCIGSIDGVNPFEWNNYTIEWTKGYLYDQFKIYVNGAYKGQCIIPLVGFDSSEVQVWADNFLIKEWFGLGHLNPKKEQGTEFDFVDVRVEKTK